MNLVIFDIDGTLSDTNRVDNEGFSRALTDVLDYTVNGSVWEGCEHITDLGLTHHIYRKLHDRLPKIYEVNRLKNRMLEHFEAAQRNQPDTFREVSGAVSFFNKLRHHPEFRVAIATGCWKESAKFKLDAIGLDYTRIPLAHSNQLLSRSDITLDALEQAKIKYRMMHFRRITYIGDGLWDLQTSNALKLNFIGIDVSGTGTLLANGATRVFPDFEDAEAILSELSHD